MLGSEFDFLIYVSIFPPDVLLAILCPVDSCATIFRLFSLPPLAVFSVFFWFFVRGVEAVCFIRAGVLGL